MRGKIKSLDKNTEFKEIGLSELTPNSKYFSNGKHNPISIKVTPILDECSDYCDCDSLDFESYRPHMSLNNISYRDDYRLLGDKFNGA